jgi:uncharacterized protein
VGTSSKEVTVARPAGRGAVVAAVGILGLSNVAINRVLPDAAYVPWNVGLTGVLAWLARRAGARPHDVGLDRRHLTRGLGTGVAAVGAVAAGYAMTLTRDDPDALRDRRASDLDAATARYHVLVRIPVGTALTEEFAFRGVVPALLTRAGATPRAASVASSVLFGLWHVLPSRELRQANDGVSRLADRVGPVGVTAVSIAATGVAGQVLHRLRVRGRHLATPVLAHWAVNALGLLAARRQT